jgi:nicotinamide-nucleotide amidase
MSDREALAERLGRALTTRGWRMACAESCTGGLVAATCTRIAGSSSWFECSFVTYTAAAKQRMLGVAAATIERHGIVSEPTAKEMALGAIARSNAQCAVAITGVAGPSGGDVVTPVGTVWFAWAARDGAPRLAQTASQHFSGDRDAVRSSATIVALEGLLALAS